MKKDIHPELPHDQCGDDRRHQVPDPLDLRARKATRSISTSIPSRIRPGPAASRSSSTAAAASASSSRNSASSTSRPVRLLLNSSTRTGRALGPQLAAQRVRFGPAVAADHDLNRATGTPAQIALSQHERLLGADQGGVSALDAIEGSECARLGKPARRSSLPTASSLPFSPLI